MWHEADLPLNTFKKVTQKLMRNSGLEDQEYYVQKPASVTDADLNVYRQKYRNCCIPRTAGG